MSRQNDQHLDDNFHYGNMTWFMQHAKEMVFWAGHAKLDIVLIQSIYRNQPSKGFGIEFTFAKEHLQTKTTCASELQPGHH